jgi:hypothetical protein
VTDLDHRRPTSATPATVDWDLPWTRQELWDAGKLLFDLRDHIYLTGHPQVHFLLSVALAVVVDTRVGNLVRPT